MKLTTISTAAAAALIAALALTACTTTAPAGNPGMGGTTAPVETTAPEFDPADLDQSGDVSEWEKQQWAKKQPREYVKADGTTTTVVPGEPLPEDVKADVAQGAQASVPPKGVGSAQSTRDFIAAKTEELGRGVVVVLRSNNDGNWVAMATGKRYGLFESKPNKDEAIAEAAKFAETMGYELIVA